MLEYTAIGRTDSIMEMTNRVKFYKGHIIKAYEALKIDAKIHSCSNLQQNIQHLGYQLNVEI